MSAEVREGYKLTVVGLIPTDWEVKRIGELCDYQNGTSLEHLFNSRDGFKVVSIGSYSTEGSYIHRDTYIDPCHGKIIAKFTLNKNDLAMSLNDKTSTGAILGRALLIKSDNEYVFNQRTMRLRPRKNISPVFLHHAINGEYLHGALVLLAKPGTQIYINTDDVIGLLVPVPPVSEQRAIATTLSDIGDLINSLDQLIAKKRDIQQATTQQLLTGQRRLPGFSGEWEVKRLGDFGQCLRGVTYKGDADLLPYDTDETYRLLRSNNVQQSAIDTDGLQFVKARSVSNHQILKPNDILICMANGSKDLVGKAGLFKISDSHRYTFGAFMGCFRMKAGTEPDFIFALFGTYKYKHYIANLLSGSSINNLRPSDIEQMEFRFPANDEQAAIAAMLSDMDSELAALEARRDKARQLKQGMMQELLTGRIRLV